MTARVSVIVPMFNAAATVERCLSSLAEQTLKLHEVIVIDDGSSDDSARIAERFVQSHPHVRVHRQENAGVSGARNRGLELATGDFIGFVDPDDFVDHRMYERLVSAALDSETSVAVLRDFTVRHSGYHRFGETKTITASSASAGLLELRYPTSVCAHLYSTELLGRIRFDENIGFFEDLLFNFRVLQRAKGVALVGGDYYHYEPGSAGANRSALNAKHLSSFDVCGQIRSVVTQQSSPELRGPLAILQGHCLMTVVYLATASGGRNRVAELKIRDFAWSTLRETFLSNDIDGSSKVVALGCAVSPGLVILIAKLARKILRTVRSRRNGRMP